MTKIFIEIKNNQLNFSIRKRLNTEQKNLMNTNVISQNELVFSDEYIINNIKILASFLRELVIETNISTVTIRENEIASLIINVIKYIPEITNVYFLQETSLTYKLCETILSTNNIKYISVYNLQEFMLEMFDKERIIVESRNEILFSSKFMTDNNLDKFSTLYYKSNLNLNFPLSELDEEDFYSFCKINKYLKTIFVNRVKLDDIEYILNILNKTKKKNIKIIINDNVQDIKMIEYLKKINNENKKKNKISFKIKYSDNYLENNIVNQLKINAIKAIILIIILIIFLIVVYVFISNYNSMQKVETIQNEIQDFIKDKSDDIQDTPIVDNNESNELQITNLDIDVLREKNPDTVGWLKVNNVNVDYPVVQAADNDYYLDKNFNRERDISGWIFMDYRNDPKNLSQNTIIFGHNMYYSGVMFGTLYKTKQASWYKEPENQIIRFDTLYETIKWQIFSIYVTPVTNDYLITNFSTDEKYSDFLNMITERSIYNFGFPVSTDDKILTLSTCSNNGRNRLVIHAVRLD